MELVSPKASEAVILLLTLVPAGVLSKAEIRAGFRS